MRALRPFLFLVMTLGSAAITVSSLVYFDAEELPPFMLEKLPLPNEALWTGALKVHVCAAAFALPACLLLLSRALLKRAPRFHRWLGRINGGVTLFALVPSGFYLSVFAKGGLPSTLGFMVSGVIVMASMTRAIAAARSRDLVTHQRFVLHVVAQMAVAVISRAMLFAADFAGLDADRAYVAALWIPVLGCAAFVELISPRRHHGPLARPLVARV